MPYSATQLRARRATVSVPYPDESNVYSITYRQGLLVNRSEDEQQAEIDKEQRIIGIKKVEGYTPCQADVIAYYAEIMERFVFAWDVPDDTPGAAEGATLPLTKEAIIAADIEVLLLQVILRDITRDASPKVIAPTS